MHGQQWCSAHAWRNGMPALDGPFIDISAPDRFLAQCRQARRLGFGGKMLIHPSQVELTHRGFAPRIDEAAQARRVVEQFQEAEANGVAAIVVDGRLVDYPVVMRAKRIVESFEAANPGMRAGDADEPVVA